MSLQGSGKMVKGHDCSPRFILNPERNEEEASCQNGRTTAATVKELVVRTQATDEVEGRLWQQQLGEGGRK